MVRMGQSLHLKIVSEGVENYADLHYLQELKCDMAQGYYFSHPLSVSNYELVLKAKQDASRA